jgi:hypothetical protein
MNEPDEPEPIINKSQPKLKKAFTLKSQSSFNFDKDVKLIDVEKLYALDTKPTVFKLDKDVV